MYVRHLGEPPAPAAEKALRDEMVRRCKGVNLVDYLVKGPDSLRAYILYLESRLAATPRLVEGRRKLQQLEDRMRREAGSGGRPPRDYLTPGFRQQRDQIFAEYPELKEFTFPDGYIVRSVDEEAAQVRCKLSRARLDLEMWLRSGARPASAGFVKMCSPPPGRPLTFWTFEGFALNDDKLNPKQLSEIDLIAGGMARDPHTRTTKPLLTIVGGFAPGEDPMVGMRRAQAVAHALANALRKKNPDLLPFIGINLVSEPWCNEAWIHIHERNAPPPNLWGPLPPGFGSRRPPMAPTGTPLPKGPGQAPKDPAWRERIRKKVEEVLKRHGVKNPSVRKAIADSTVFQGEQGLRSSIGQSGLDFEEQGQAIKEILNRGDE